MAHDATAGGIALLERAINYLLGSLRPVTPEALARPTPCAGWDLRALLAHLDDSLGALTEAVEAGAAWPPPRRALPPPAGCQASARRTPPPRAPAGAPAPARGVLRRRPPTPPAPGP